MFKNSVDEENIAVMYLRLSKEDGEKEINLSYAKSMLMMDIQEQLLIDLTLKK